MGKWINFFNLSLDARGTEDFIDAGQLRAKLIAHDGREAYHSAFDLDDDHLKLEEDTGERDDKGRVKYRYHAQTPETLKRWPKTVTEYEGPMRPAMGLVWFDFDSADGGVQAWTDTQKFWAKLGKPEHAQLFYSGSKGFHLGIPFAYFGLPVTADLGKKLNTLARRWKKKDFPSIDTTVFNPQRKFRALGSKHPKTGRYKIWLDLAAIKDAMPLDDIKRLSLKRLNVEFPPTPAMLPPLDFLVSELSVTDAPMGDASGGDSISLAEWKRYKQPDGAAAFTECGFLGWAKTNPGSVNEPQWYACASIVGRFKDGRKQFHAMSKGHPGYSESNTNDKLDQALESSGPRTCQAIDSLWSGCKECKHYQKINSPVVILGANVIPTEATGFYSLYRKDNGTIGRVPNFDDLLLAFERDTPYKTIADMKSVYAFTGTHYEEKTPIEIRGFAENKFSPAPKEKERSEFVHKVFANRITKRNFFTSTTDNKINFRNGIVELDADGADATASPILLPHDAKFGFRNCLPYDFDPNAKCPTFDTWIRDVMLGDEELVAILQEFMGYVVRGGDYTFHKALWLSGSGRNGKSTFLSVLKALIGTDNYSTLSIRQIINDKFSSAALDGKIANFSEETSPEELSDSGPFKNLTGDGELLAQKKYGDPYKFVNRAKLIMTYNEVPQLKDLSPGMLSRPIIIPWKKDLTDESAQDKNLKKKLLAELPGIFNFAFEGWRRLERNEGFSKSAKSQLEMEEIRITSCTAAAWVAENIEFLPIGDKEKIERVKPRQLYEAYKLTVGQYAFGENKFYKRIGVIPRMAERKNRFNGGVEFFSLRMKRQTSSNVDF